MAPQLQINQGPQDALLFDNTKSYFTNVGYTRTSNFQMELRDVDPQNTANLGATVNFVIPKAADLLGPTDLMIEFAEPTNTPGSDKYWGWVESIGYAMIDKITFSVGSHDIEVLTGDHLNIMNELMRSETHRYGFDQIGKTGRPLVRGEVGANGTSAADADGMYFYTDDNLNSACYDRLIAYDGHKKNGKKLIIPLGLFFTAHPSKYFPLAAIAGCNDVRISVKFKTLSEVLMCTGTYAGGSGDAAIGNSALTATSAQAAAGVPTFSGSAFASKGCYLRCHYIHVTGPEATALMNREHVRLMKLWNGNEVSKIEKVGCSSSGKSHTISLDLSFLHPVQELVITIRKVSDMGSETSNALAIGTGDKPIANTASSKNYFAYHGSGKDPNLESWNHWLDHSNGTRAVSRPTYLLTESISLKLNGQSRHLDGAGIDRDYLMNRLMPMLHSNTRDEYSHVVESHAARDLNLRKPFSDATDFEMLAQLKDRKEIYVYPFALNPEGANPSGSVNFSKVSHAKLDIKVLGFSPDAGSDTDDQFQVDVYGVYYNWLAIKDGRALTSFA